MNSGIFNTKMSVEFGLTQEGFDYLEQTRNSPPSRVVGRKTRKSLVVHYQSKKMGCSIVCESSLERFAAIEFELSKSVTEYYPQPPKRYVQKKDKRGRKITTPHTADFLIVRSGEICAIQVKSAKEIEHLLVKKPWEWITEKGKVINVPIRAHFSSMGVSHEIVAPDSCGTIRFANLLILDAVTKLPWCYSDKEVEKLVGGLERTPCMTISNAAKALGKDDVTGVIQLIARGFIHCDLDKALLDMPDSTIVSLKSNLLNLTEYEDSSSSSADAGVFGGLSTRDLSIAVERLERVSGHGNKNRTRNDYRLLSKLADGRRQGISDVVAMAPNISKRGNRSPKVAPEVSEFASKFITENLYQVKGRQKGALYYRYRVEASECHPKFPPVSKPTFYGYLKSRNQVDVAFAQQGLRAANAACSASEIEHRHLKSAIPFMEASVDHYKTDVFTEILGHGDIRITKKLYLTVLVDIASGAVLSFYLSINPPSRASVAIVLRKCVQVWGRLPRSIRVDRGAEFKSVYQDAVFAHFCVCKVMSPASHPRFGAEVERSFLYIKNNWLSGRPGYVVDFGSRRGIDSSLDAPAQASLSPLDLIKELRRFFEIRNSNPQGVRSKSAITMIDEAFSKFDFCGVKINYDKNFIVDTAVDLRKFSLCSKRGIKVNDMFFWHPLMANPTLAAYKLDVRLEPENPYVLYVYLEGRWHEAYAAGYQRYKSISDDDVRMAECLWMHQGSSIRRQLVEDVKTEMAKAQRTFDEEYAADKFLVNDVDAIEVGKHNDEAFTVEEFSFEEWDVGSSKSWGVK